MWYQHGVQIMWYPHSVHVKPTWCTCDTHMVYMWNSHGVHVKPTWCTCETYMVYMSNPHGVHMIYPHGVHVKLTWCTCDTHLVYMWYSHGVLVKLRKCTCDTHMVYMRYPHGIHVIYQCSVHAMIPTWCACDDTYMVCMRYMWYLCGVHVPTWCLCMWYPHDFSVTSVSCLVNNSKSQNICKAVYFIKSAMLYALLEMQEFLAW